MSAKIPQLSAILARLDNAIESGRVRQGARFLYTINGVGKCYEGTLHEISPEGHVRLNNSGVWDWPPEVRIEEILSHPEKVLATESRPVLSPVPLPPVAPVAPSRDSAPVLPSAKTTTTKPKRYL